LGYKYPWGVPWDPTWTSLEVQKGWLRALKTDFFDKIVIIYGFLTGKLTFLPKSVTFGGFLPPFGPAGPIFGVKMTVYTPFRGGVPPLFDPPEVKLGVQNGQSEENCLQTDPKMVVFDPPTPPNPCGGWGLGGVRP
jgi:hypothetical protein